MTEKEPILTVNDLGLRRSERWLFRGLSFSLNAGELIQVTGRNGAGKTSLLRCLCGLLPEQEGTINWATKDDIPLIPYFYGHLPAVKTELSVLENLLYHPINRQFYSEAVCEQALYEVGLGDYLDVMAKNLSAGQTRRVALARLLVSDFKCWVLDEPFTALDISACQWLEGIVSKYVQSGGSVLLTSHQAASFDVPITELEITEDMSSYV